MYNVHRLTVAASAAALSLGLVACSGEEAATPATPTTSIPATSSSSSGTDNAGSTAAATVSAEHNAADVAFAQQMIVHHRGALAMAEMAQEQAHTPQVKALARRVTAAQGPEIDAMSSWLRAWDQEVPEGMSMPSTGSTGGMEGMHEGMEGMGGDAAMPGMMSPEQMKELRAASGAQFDRMWLSGMTAHHQGAVQMARTEQDQGLNPQAIALAKVIEADQTSEIEEMATLLENL